MHTEGRFAKRSMTHRSISKIGQNLPRRQRVLRRLGDVFSADRELLRRLDPHLDAASGAAEQRD